MLATALLVSFVPFLSPADLPPGVATAAHAVPHGGGETRPGLPSTITALVPTGIPVGAPQLLLTVQGTGFLATAEVEFGNQLVPTTVVSATELLATVPGSELEQGVTRSVRVRNSGTTSNPMPFTIRDAQLTGLSPGAVLVGSPTTTVTLTGANFGTWSQVRLSNQLRATTFLDDSHLSIVLDASELQAAGSATVQVDNLPNQAGGTSNGLQFLVTNLLLSSLSPGSALVGSATFQLTATGQGFGATSRIRFNGHLLTTVSSTATSVIGTADAPYVQSPGTFGVEVVGSATGGGTSNQLMFDVANPVPGISGIAPASATVGSSTNGYLTITGSGFVNQSDVLWNGNQRPTQFLDSATLRMDVDNHDYDVAAIVQIQVRNPAPGGGLSPAVTFAVNNPLPTIGSITPTAYQAGSPAATLTISGSGFNAQSAVDIDGAPVPINSVNPGMLSLTVSAASLAAARIATLRVTNPAPGGGFASVPLSITNPVPAVTSLAPTSVVFGSSPIQLDVLGPAIGANFNSQSVVLWNGASLPTTLVSGNQLRADVDAARLSALAYVSVSVSNPAPGGGTSSALTFTVGNPVATLTSLSPASIATGSAATVVTITGANLALGCVARWNGQALPTTRLSGTQATAVVPVNLLYYGGVYAIRVDNTAPGGGASNALSFTVINPAPALTAVAPSTLPTSPSAATITATGTNFVRQSLVRCNGTSLTTNWVGATTLTASVPASFLAAAGSLSITVFTPTPGGGISQSRVLTIVNPVPALTGVSPMLEAVGVPAVLTLAGSGFNSQSSLRITWAGNPGGYVFAPSSVSPSSMTVVVPSGYFGSPLEVRLAVTNPAPGGGTSGLLPFAFAAPSTASVDGSPVTFSVGGPVHAQTDGLRWPRGVGPSTPYALRAPTVAPALGLFTPQPGDVQDYAVTLMPSEAELFQSEPVIGAGRPSGTNNQILVADAVGLVAAPPVAPWRDNIDGVSFGEDWFGVTAVNSGTWPLPYGTASQWRFRTSVFLPNTVSADIGTSFRFTVNPYARGLRGTGLAIESLRFEDGIGIGPWLSYGDAASEVFGTPTLTLPGVPALGGNELVHDRVALGLANVFGGAMGAEDDIDALESIGDNDPASWMVMAPGMGGAGDLHGRVMDLPLHGSYLPDGLSPPGVSIHGVGVGGMTSAPLFFTVDRRSTGKALSAVRTQARLGEAAGDVFMAWNDSNLLLIDEQEAGLYPGILGLLPCDDMDALILKVHPDDRYYLIELAQYYVPYSGLVVEHDPNPGITGDEYRTGPGYSYSLLRYAWDRDARKLRLRLGFSVTTDSIGLEGTPVDYETGLDPSGTMQQAGDVYFTQFGVFDPAMGEINPVPEFADLGTHFLWYEENAIGLEAGSWTVGVSTDFAALPDELNALDSTPLAPGGPGLQAYYGLGCAGTGGTVPSLDVTGRATDNRVLAFGVSGGLAGAPCFFVQGMQAVDVPFLPGCNLLVPAGSSVASFAGLLLGTGAGDGTQRLTMRLPPGLAGFEFTTQAGILDSGGPTGLLSTTRGVMVRLE